MTQITTSAVPPAARRPGASAVAASALLGLAALAAHGQDFSRVDQQVERMLDRFPVLQGAGVLVGTRDGFLYEAYYGSYDETTRVPLASASKLVSAVSVMRLVESGDLNRFAPIRQYVPEFSPDKAGVTKSSLTIDQCYSMTSGFPSEQETQQILGDPTIMLAQAVERIALEVPLVEPPSSSLLYSGAGMHVVGRACEVASGLPFDEFFDAAVNDPLGINITWDGLNDSENFRPSGGGRASLSDYGAVAWLVLNRGEAGGVRLLQPGTVETMFTERTVGLPIASAPPQAVERGFGYAFGMWIEERDADGRPTVLTSPGAFGFTPVLDLEDEYFAVIMVEGSNSQLLSDLDAIRASIDSAMAAPCREADVDLDADNDVFDALDFIGAYSPGLPSDVADIDGDGDNDVFDALRFVGRYNPDRCPVR